MVKVTLIYYIVAKFNEFNILVYRLIQLKLYSVFFLLALYAKLELVKFN